MKVIAPGKLVLTGAYAVLEGAPAIVVAVDRYAIVDVATPDAVDVKALHDEDGRKLGLGSSAASRVVSQAARCVAVGDDLSVPRVRDSIFDAAREDHAHEQRGGSGVDVAAAVHGGVLEYTLIGDRARSRPVELPPGLVLQAYFSGVSARTSELRARVDAWLTMTTGGLVNLGRLAHVAAARVHASDTPGFILAARDYGRALDTLGRVADAPIVLPPFATLAVAAEKESAAFLPSGAGGGDVAVWLGQASPSPSFTAAALALGMRPLTLSVDRGGVRVLRKLDPKEQLS